jgi:cell shape-determining protein MreD
MNGDVYRYARFGVWGLPIFAATLFAGTITHQPPPQTDLADWSRYVTTNEFLFSHIVFSIFGSVFGAIGSVSLGIVLMERGSVKLGLAGLLTGLTADVLGPSIFGIAAFAQPAIGRFYLAGHHDLAQNLYYDAAQGTPMVVVALVFILLLVSSFIVFAVIGFELDNWVQSVAAVLMTVTAAWMVLALRSQAKAVLEARPAI